MAEISRVDVMHSVHIDFYLLLTFSVDYNSWQESDKGLRLAASLDRNVILAEGMHYYYSLNHHVVALGKNRDRVQRIQHWPEILSQNG